MIKLILLRVLTLTIVPGFIFLSHVTHATEKEIRYHKSLFSYPLFTVQNNHLLPNKEVLKLVQDETGFIWLGTRTGVFRFDGYQYSKLIAQNDPALLENIHVRSFLTDGKYLWIGTMSRGLFKVNLTDRFTTHYPNTKSLTSIGGNQINGIESAGEGRLWIAHSQGLDLMDVESETFEHYISADDPSDRYFNYLLDVKPDTQGRIWLATAKGIAVVSAQGRAFSLVGSLNGETSLNDVVARRLYLASDGRLWIVTQKQGTFIVDPQANNVRQIAQSEARVHAINTSITESEPDRQGNRQIWISGYDGVEVRDSKTGELLKVLTGNLLNQIGLKNSTVYPVMTSRSGLIWFGVHGEGLQFFAPQTAQFKVLEPFSHQMQSVLSSFIQNVVRVNDTQILVMSSEKPYFVDLKGGGVQPFIKTEEFASTSAVGAAREGSGTYWFGTSNGSLLKVSPQGEVLEEILLPLSKNDGVFVYHLLLDGNTLWVGCDRGLLSYNIQTGQFTVPKNDQGNPFIAFVRDIFLDHSGRLWAGTTNGVALVSPDGTLFTVFNEQEGTAKTLTNNYVVQILETSENQLLVATREGVFQLISESEDEKRFAPFAELAMNDVSAESGLLATPDGGILIGTEGKVDRQGVRLSKLTALDGNILEGREKAFFRLNAKDYLYATANDIVLFGDDVTSKWVYEPPLVITEAQVDNTNIRIDPEKPVISLSPENRELSVRFAALDYTRPQDNQYRYKLIGYDKDWIPTPWDVRQVRYTSLPPGAYELLLQGSNRRGHWAEPAIQIGVEVEPKYYQTVWFVFISLASLLVLMIGLFRWQLALANRRQRKKLHQQQAEERAEMLAEMMMQKNQMLAEFSHDLRTPIAMMKVQLEAMQDGVLKPDENTYNSLQERISNLSLLINDIGRLSQEEGHNLVLNKERASLRGILTDAVDGFRPLLDQHNLALTIENQLKPEDGSYVLADKDRIRQVIFNLLQNSIRYTKQGGQIRITLTEANNTQTIVIEDSTPAVSETEMARVFERDFRGEVAAKSAEGSGLGLWICKAIVDAHGGNITVQHSNLGGIAVRIALPTA